MANDKAKLESVRLMVIGALADSGMLETVRATQARIEAVVVEAEQQAEGVGDGALTLAYLDHAIKELS